MSIRENAAYRILSCPSWYKPKRVSEVVDLEGDEPTYDPIAPFEDVGAGKTGFEIEGLDHLLSFHAAEKPAIVNDNMNLVFLWQNKDKEISGYLFTDVLLTSFKRSFRGEASAHATQYKYRTLIRIEGT